MSKKNIMLKNMSVLLKDYFDEEKLNIILDSAKVKFFELCEENKNETKAVKAHTVEKIYPVIALFNAMLQEGLTRNEAYEILDKCCSKNAEPQAEAMRKALKIIPGSYKLMPKIFKFVTINSFGKNAGFDFKFYDVGKKRVKFDMTKCLYCEICKKNGCPELIRCFCHTDDVTDGNMHPKLKWNRSKIMGDGADCCDFDLIVTE